MSEQQKTKQAEHALDALQHAVDQAQSHPSSDKIEEADNAVAHAEIAVRQAEDSGNAGALSQQLNEEKETLGGLNG
ncbi:hypothetical protein GE107_16455 [Cohnella sp. CFH 77786]|uniref:hypothetical protein n=1 Tax=Cohnella sp. CFH 77786 TaxID=2662265 RepID=UPI001C6094DC|nr:hypothetical protein [Cohnella sp. CFH 77786]MBW5447650.1 hypothetical protein [Cohnella sp. CFH 77786]